MLGIRHRCGQEIQFWIPAAFVPAHSRRLDEEVDTRGLASWMAEQGMLTEEEEPAQEELVERLRLELAPRDVAFIDVENDISECPKCGALLRWLDILTEYAQSGRAEGGSDA